MSDPFERMHDRLFAHLGEGAVLRGVHPCTVSAERGVAFSGEYNDVTVYRTVVEIRMSEPKTTTPKKGDPVSIESSGKIYILDALVKEDGYASKWVVL